MSLLHDLRSSSRTLIKHPGFAITTTLILALGIGANTTIFSVVNAVLIRPLPYEEPDRIVMIWETNQSEGVQRSIVSPANFLDWKNQNRVFENLAVFDTRLVVSNRKAKDEDNGFKHLHRNLMGNKLLFTSIS